MIIEILLIILLNALPLIIIIIPLLFIWKKYIGKVYFRIILGEPFRQDNLLVEEIFKD